MASYELRIKRDAEKEIRELPKKEIERVVSRIHSLRENPRPIGSEKLKGEEGYRVRQGDYRIVYLIDEREKAVTVIRVGHRREVYR